MLVMLVIVLLGANVAFPAEPKQKAGEATSAAATTPMQAAEEKAIRETAEAFSAAFNKGDAKAVAALWTADCEYVDNAGRIFRGRDAIEREYATFFAAHPKVKIETAVSSVKMFGNSAATEDGTSVVKSLDGAVLSRGSYTALHLKQGSKWLMASVREHGSPSLSERPAFADLEWLIGDWTCEKDSKALDFSFKWIADKKFIELSYSARDKGAPARSGIQIIGRSPSSGQLISWSFDSTGGHGQGIWKPLKRGVLIESQGMMPDGALTMSREIVSKIDADSLSLQSVNRRVAGQSLNDSEPLILKRKRR